MSAMLRRGAPLGREFVDYRHPRAHGRSEKRQLVFVLKESDGKLERLILEQTRFEENHADANPHTELQDRERTSAKPFANRGDVRA